MATFKGETVKVATLTTVREIVRDKQAAYVNWEVDKFKPLLVDMTSANMLLTVYEALKEQEQRDKIERMICASRGSFSRVMDFVWKVCT